MTFIESEFLKRKREEGRRKANISKIQSLVSKYELTSEAGVPCSYTQ